MFVCNHTVYLDNEILNKGHILPEGVDAATVEMLLENGAISEKEDFIEAEVKEVESTPVVETTSKGRRSVKTEDAPTQEPPLDSEI